LFSAKFNVSSVYTSSAIMIA